jgi:hypothetical protein
MKTKTKPATKRLKKILKVPKCWEPDPDKNEPGILAFRAPVSEVQKRYLELTYSMRGDERPFTYRTCSTKGWRFEQYAGEPWMRLIRKRDPNYKPPPRFIMIYGLPTKSSLVILRCPGELPWKTLLPNLQKVAREYKRSLHARGDEKAYLEGAEPEMWRSKKFTSYDWAGERFKLVRRGTEDKA